jgi:hypothetical protein
MFDLAKSHILIQLGVGLLTRLFKEVGPQSTWSRIISNSDFKSHIIISMTQ